MRTSLRLAASAVAVLAVVCVSLAAAPSGTAPKGWWMAGSNPEDYSTGLAQGRGAYLAAKAEAAKGFGTLMQTFTAETYRGKRLRMSAAVRAEDIKEWAGLWMRVDGTPRATLSFDNMQDRPIKGTSGWQRYEVVLDVPQESTTISFGILLSGVGTAFIDDVAFEVVPATVATTGSRIPSSVPSAPVNLSFED